MAKKSSLRFPVVSAGAEFLVMGHLMRRNTMTYKAPPGNEGYDLICIHPDPRRKPTGDEKSLVRVQVKSRYASDCDRGFLVKQASLNAFDFLVVAFLNIGTYFRGQDGSSGEQVPEFYALPHDFVQQHHDASTSWQKVQLRALRKEIEQFKNADGFEKIADALGIERPIRTIEPR